MGTGALRTIPSRVVWMFLPVERSITLSAPQRMAHTSFSTSSSMLEVTAELPMLALILTLKLRPMAMGSSSGWLMFAGMMARQRATSARTNSGVMVFGMSAPMALPPVCLGQVLRHPLALAVLAQRHIFHLLRDDAAPGVVHLRDIGAGLGAQRRALQGCGLGAQSGQARGVGALWAIVARQRSTACVMLHIATAGDPAPAHAGQAPAHIDHRLRIGVGAGTVVHTDLLAVGQRDVTHRHAQIGI